MEDAAVFSTLAQCFGPVGEDEWAELTDSAQWSDFLAGARRLVQDDRPLGTESRPTLGLRARLPLQEFLSGRELSALFAPPGYQEKSEFAARHFTGGLPDSAVPVESLYQPAYPDRPGVPAGGGYLGDAALYVRDVVDDLGLEVPPAFAACPDHLALELDLVAVLLRSGMEAPALAFLAERFGWLTAYRARLLELDEDASFYIGLIDLIMGIVAQQEPFEEGALNGCAMDSVA